MLAHNAITNDTNPTEQNDQFTEVFMHFCIEHKLKLKDHLVLSEYGKYYSYADNNRL